MDQRIDTRCCIAGGAPAGMMLAFLLARMGVAVVVLEKHADFLRDFRGDTIHPSTLDIMYELGLTNSSRVPTRNFSNWPARWGRTSSPSLTSGCADALQVPGAHAAVGFSRLRQTARAALSGFPSLMEAEVTGLIEENGIVAGVRARTPQGPLDVRAGLVVGADGRKGEAGRIRERGLEAFREEIGRLEPSLRSRLQECRRYAIGRTSVF